MVVGRVCRAHGIRGELRVEAFGAGGEALLVGGGVLLRAKDGAGERSLVIEGLRPGPRGMLLLRLSGVSDRTLAETFHGWEVLVEEDALPALEDEEFYYFQLEGLEVVNQQGEALGKVTGVFNAGASDVAVVVGDRGEWMFPVVDDVVVEINEEAGQIVIHPVPGLLEGGI